MNNVQWFAAGFVAYAALGYVVSRLTHKTVLAASVNEDGAWCFPVDTLEQMLEIPVSRRERFLAELPDMFTRMWALRDTFPLATARGASWVDDEKGEFRPTILNAPDNAADAFASRPLRDA